MKKKTKATKQKPAKRPKKKKEKRARKKKRKPAKATKSTPPRPPVSSAAPTPRSQPISITKNFASRFATKATSRQPSPSTTRCAATKAGSTSKATWLASAAAASST